MEGENAQAAHFGEQSVAFLYFGGSVGFIVGMKIFSHKTKHLKFTVGVPLVLLIQVIIGYFVYMKRFA